MARKARGEEAETPTGDLPVSPKKAEPLSLPREIAVIVLSTATLLTLLSLVSYHPYDPGALSFGTLAVRPDNWVGILGAYWSYLLVHAMGLVSLWLPLLLGRVAWLVLTRAAILRPGRILLWTSVILSQATLLQFAFGSPSVSLWGQDAPLALGGVAGIVLGELSERAFGFWGASIFLPVWVLLTLMLFWRISFLEMAGRSFSPVRRLMDAWKMRAERKRQEESREQARVQVRQRQEERIKKQEEKKSVSEKPIRVSAREPAAPALPLEAPPDSGRYRLPPTDLLDPPRPRPPVNEQALRAKAQRIEERLQEFSILGEIVEIHPGPVVTVFEFKPAPGVKYTSVLTLHEDLALALKADHIRIERVSGKSHIGIEVPNENREIISFRELIESRAYTDAPGKLPIVLGKTVDGEPYVTTLDQMPHILVAGTTGSGKSVGINALIHSILFRSTPEEVKFILVDPKQVELKVYEDIPHLLTPVVTDVKKAANAMNWAVREMTERYKLLASAKVKNIDQYNAFVRSLTPTSAGDLGINQPLPYIVIVIDELYDLMAAVAKEVETAIARLSAMARAVGIHLILATQRPSRDVITGVIKSNLPCRLAYQVREKLESRLILDQNGAESLEGKGDMLYLPPGSGRLMRLHGGFLSNAEAQRVIQYLQKQGEPAFEMEVLKDVAAADGTPGAGGMDDEEDPLYRDAVKLVVQTGVASASNLQRRMRIGYARAARILDVMEHRGLVGPADGAKPREILVDPSEIE
jgi:S-DNA-T family DNA segregation ATPase FtsK/SpoIIIE